MNTLILSFSTAPDATHVDVLFLLLVANGYAENYARIFHVVTKIISLVHLESTHNYTLRRVSKKGASSWRWIYWRKLKYYYIISTFNQLCFNLCCTAILYAWLQAQGRQKESPQQQYFIITWMLSLWSALKAILVEAVDPSLIQILDCKGPCDCHTAVWKITEPLELLRGNGNQAGYGSVSIWICSINLPASQHVAEIQS